MKLRICLAETSLTALLLFFCNVLSTMGQEKSSCQKKENEVIEAYYGWPVDISCLSLSDYYYYSKSYEDIESFLGQVESCIIKVLPSGKTVHNESYVYKRTNDMQNDAYFTEDITDETPTLYEVKYMIDKHCSYHIVQLDKMEVSAFPCEDFKTQDIQVQAEMGSDYNLGCGEMPLFLEHLDDAHELSYKWKFECSKTMTNDNDDSKMLEIKDFSFKNVGTYTCFATYKDQDIFFSRVNVCMKFRSTAEHGISVHCPTTQLVKIGQDAEITCNADLGVGKANSILVHSMWMKTDSLSSDLCQNRNEGFRGKSKRESKFDCSTKSSAHRRCYNSTNPPPDSPPRDKYQVKLKIKNTSTSDLGTYTMNFRYGASQFHVRNITLIGDNTKTYSGVGIAAILVVCLLLATIAFLLICTWKKRDFLWCWKKFCGQHEPDVYPYTTYMAYYYDTDEEKMTEKSRNSTEMLVTNLEEFITKQMHGTIYNDQKQVNMDQRKTDKLLQVLSECHRIVILLSPEFINDHWSLHTTHQALHEVVNTGKKLIFIAFPGAMKAIALSDIQTRNTLQSAMKRNTTVQWCGKIPFASSFKRRIEYALPKLRPEGREFNTV